MTCECVPQQLHICLDMDSGHTPGLCCRDRLGTSFGSIGL